MLPVLAADDASTVTLVTEQLVVVGTLLGAIAALPALIEFLVERRKRRERIDLALDDEPVAGLQVRLAGLDELLDDIADLIDRARHPEAYRSLTLGNEILIVGPPASGKKTLARRVAQLAGMDRVITVYNPRSPDALAAAKRLLRRERSRVMLLLPNLDDVISRGNEEVQAELDALIETTSARHNVLVVGTAARFEPDGDLDDLFGVKLTMPGTPPIAAPPGREVLPEMARVLDRVARFYLKRACDDGATLSGLTQDEAAATLVAAAASPAEIEDVVEVARTSALYRQRRGLTRGVEISPDTLARAIGRVIAATT